MRNLHSFVVLCESAFKTLRKMTDYVQQGPDMIACGGVGCEKIQLCSTNGSEASLVQNGHFSSVSASKRTLTSQDNILDSAAKSSPLPATDSCGSLAEASDSVYSAGDFSNVEPRAAPSYLKLSRAIGGYTPYNTYTSVTEHARLRTDNCFGGSKLQSSDKQYRGDSEAILQNGEPVVTIKQQPHETPVYGSTEQHSPSVLLDSCGDTSAGQVVPSGNNFCLSSFVDARSSNQSFSPVAFSGLSCGAVPSVSILPPSDLKGSEALVTTLDDGMPNSCDVPFERSFLSICNDLADSEASPKNGHYFLILVDNAERWLKLHCDRTEVDLQATISDEVEGKMRTAIGKGNLLIQKKFPQFRQLCHANLSQKEGDPFKTTEQDLSGFWDMVLLQVEDVNKHFEEIEQLRQNGWNEIKTSLEICPESATPSSSSKPSGTRTRMQKSNSATNVRSPALSSSAAAKAREEARKRLMAAKAVGRQRKASESDKDIEIFVS